jgi:hypothetical protein
MTTQKVPRRKRSRPARRTVSSDTRLVSRALALSRLPAERFAREVVGVNPATLRRWRWGYTPLNRYRRAWFKDYVTT